MHHDFKNMKCIAINKAMQANIHFFNQKFIKNKNLNIIFTEF